MLYWSEYSGHIFECRKDKDLSIYTFDIETTSYYILNDQIYKSEDYVRLSEKEKEECIPQATMYIWQFSVNDIVYYGRTWKELKLFMDRLELTSNKKKIIYVHNLSFEFQFIQSVFKISKVFARKSRRLMKCELQDYNVEFRCSLYLSGIKLEKLPEIYGLPDIKLTGNLDYSKIRTSKTQLTKVELDYCEHDCLVLYEYICKESDIYGDVFKIPLTNTGKVRRELQNLVMKDESYREIVAKAINIKPLVYNLLVDSFAGGYTHANYMYSDEVLKNIDSYDETSAYPYVMVTEKFPMSKFIPCKIKSVTDLLPNFAYLIKVKFNHIRCKYYNNFISASKCEKISGSRIDNGRIIEAKEIIISLTDIDFRLFCDTYDIESYEILSSYYALKSYLPKKFIKFILEKYKNKTIYKGDNEHQLEYNLEKSKFNSLYGMTVTNLIRDEVEYDNVNGWFEKKLDDSQIYDKLLAELSKSFLSFAWGVWVTAYARDNLLRRVIDLDEYVVYCDTDSIKCVSGYNKRIFEDYNNNVLNKLQFVSKHLNIDYSYYSPKDRKGVEHPLGVFEFEGYYDKFITQGAKKYCIEKDGDIEITVSGVPKSGNKCLSRIEDFRDDLVFKYQDTNKHTIIYNDYQKTVDIIDYNGVKCRCNDLSGAVLLPAEYTLNKSYDYTMLLTDNSSERAKFKRYE